MKKIKCPECGGLDLTLCYPATILIDQNPEKWKSYELRNEKPLELWCNDCGEEFFDYAKGVEIIVQQTEKDIQKRLK